jgi:hypothetical protein
MKVFQAGTWASIYERTSPIGTINPESDTFIRLPKKDTALFFSLPFSQHSCYITHPERTSSIIWIKKKLFLPVFSYHHFTIPRHPRERSAFLSAGQSDLVRDTSPCLPDDHLFWIVAASW